MRRRRPASAKPFLISPLFAFPVLWAAGAALAQIKLVDLQRPWSPQTWLVVAVVPVVFVLGGLVGNGLAAGLVRWRGYAAEGLRLDRRGRVRLILLACVAVGLLEQAHQFAAADTIPLFSASVDQARFALPGGPTVILTDLLTVAAIVAIVIPARLLARDALPELFVATTGLGGHLLAGGRGTVVFAVAAAAISRWLFWGPPRATRFIAVAVALAAFLSAFFLFRIGQTPDDPFSREVSESVLPSVPWLLRPLVPLHFGLALSFDALARVVEYFPAGAPYGEGRYNALGFDLVIPGTLDLSQVTGALSPPWVTATVAGPLWADGGLFLVVLGVAASAALACFAYEAARRTRELRWALVAGYLVFTALFGVYQNLWTQQVDWLLIAPLLFAVGWYAQAEPADDTRSVRHRGSRLAPFAPPAAVLLALVVAGAALYHVERVPPEPVRVGLPCLVTNSDSGRKAPAAGRDAILVSDGDQHERPATESAWALAERGDDLVAARAFARPARWQRIGARPDDASRFDIARWPGPRGRRTLFVMRPTRTGVVIGGITIERRPRPALLTAIDDRPPARASTRELAIARWSGRRPDLFILDRSASAGRGWLTVYTGESRFRRRALTRVRLRLGVLATRAFHAEIATVTRPRPDLVFVSRGRLADALRPEVHVFPGELGFRRPAFSARVSNALADTRRLVVAASPAGATIFGVDRSQRVTRVPILNAPPRIHDECDLPADAGSGPGIALD